MMRLNGYDLPSPFTPLYYDGLEWLVIRLLMYIMSKSVGLTSWYIVSLKSDFPQGLFTLSIRQYYKEGVDTRVEIA